MKHLTKRQIQQIIFHTPEELHGKALGSAAMVEELGCFQPEDANWSYRAGWLNDGQLVVMVFGTIK